MSPEVGVGSGAETARTEGSRAESEVPAAAPVADRAGTAGPPPLTQFLTYRIARLHHAMNAQAVAILAEVSGISLGQWRVLAVVGSGGAMTARDLARHAGYDPAFISRTVRALEVAGLVRTSRSDADRRMLSIALTGQGGELYARTLPFMHARQEALLGALAPDERDAVFVIIEKLERAAERRKFTA